VTVLATWKRGADPRFANELSGRGVAVQLIGPCHGPLSWRWGLSRTVRNAIREVDVVHIHAVWEEVQHQAALAARRNGKPYLIRPCGMLDPWSLSQASWKKALYLRWRLRGNLNRASALHFTTSIERELTQPLKLSVRSIVEPNGIRLAEFDNLPERGGFRRQHGIPDGIPMCLFLGRVHPKKGLDLLLPAFAALGQPAHLVIAGPIVADYRAILEASIAKLQLNNRVCFVGMLRGPEKLAAFADADLFVLPSRQENFGNAVIEALATGVPVVISDQVNLWPEIKDAAVGGVIPLEVEAITRELHRWLSNSELRAQAARRAKSFVRERFDWNTIAHRWTGHYAALMAHPTQ
jgi:glycosyltransferase involved in cell wall biosynthesis